jgi:hypothetical protein
MKRLWQGIGAVNTVKEGGERAGRNKKNGCNSDENALTGAY